MKKVYLDTSIYNRPFDDQTQPKIFLETQAVIIIFQTLGVQSVELVSSSVLEYRRSMRCTLLVLRQPVATTLLLATSGRSIGLQIWQ